MYSKNNTEFNQPKYIYIYILTPCGSRKMQIPHFPIEIGTWTLQTEGRSLH